MRYFIDSEYIWNPTAGRIQPVSLALFAEDGREFYVQNINAYPDTAFVQDHVWPHLDNMDAWHTRQGESRPWAHLSDWRTLIRAFIGGDIPEFWGDYAAFDYVILSMVMGRFEDWPADWPMHINDLQQIPHPTVESTTPHHALCDARAVHGMWVLATAEDRPRQ